MTHLVLIALGVLIAVLAVVSVLGILPSLRIVPDDTHFDFTQFRRISFPISAALSIIAITLFFTHGLNFGIDFKGGTLLEVRAKSGAADIAAMGEALSLVIGGLNHEHALIFAAASTLLQVFVPYRRYAPVLKFMTLVLFAYVVTAFTVRIPWSTAALAAIWQNPTSAAFLHTSERTLRIETRPQR